MKNIKILLSAAIVALFLLPSYGQLKVVAAGDVGIGTSTPERKLDVVGNSQSRGQFLFTGKDAAAAAEASVLVGWGRTGTGSSAIRFYPAWTNFGSWATTFGVDATGGGGLFHKGGNTLGIVTQNTQPLALGVNNAYKIYVNGTSGFVGINTITPAFDLEVGTGTAAKPGGGSWTVPSDKRLKKDVKPFEDGLKQVMAIEPVFFKYNGKGGLKDDGKEYVGIIAQDMQKVAPYTVGSFKRQIVESTMKEGDYLPSEVVKGEEEYLSYDANAVTYMLVNAIKEQQKMIDARDVKIEALEERLERLERLMVTLSTTNGSQTVTLSNNSNGALMQNQPNPFNQTTSIRYSLPENANNAALRIMDTNGRLLKEVKLTDVIGEVTINAGELNSGTYSYSLVVDGRIMDTKQMILTK